MAYVPPTGSVVELAFTDGYRPPNAGDVNLEFDPSQPSPRAVGGWRSSAYGQTTIRLAQHVIRPRGWINEGKFGATDIDLDIPRIRPLSIDPQPDQVSSPEYVRWPRWLYPTAIDEPSSPQSVRRVRLLGGYNPPPGSNVIVNWTTEPYTPPPGANTILEFGALGYGRIFGATLFDQLQFGTASVGQTDAILPSGWVSSEWGSPVVQTSSRTLFASSFYDEAFGTAVLTKAALGLTAVGIAPTSVIGTPFIAYRIRYVAPNGVAAPVWERPVITNWIRYVLPEGKDSAVYGTAVVTQGERTLAASGFDRSVFGTAFVENKDRYYNLLGWTSSIVAVGARVWDGKQYAINVTLGDGMFVPNPIVSVPAEPPDDTQTVDLSGQGLPITENQVWPLHKVENQTKQLFVDGFTSFGLPSPAVNQTIYLTIRPLGADWSVFGLPFVDQTIKKLYPEGFTGEFVPASHQIYSFTTDVVAGGITSYISGAHAVTRGTARPVVTGIASKAVVATGLRVEYRSRLVSPVGYDATLFGSGAIQNKNVGVLPGGIAPLPQTGPANQWRIPQPTIWYRVRYLDLTDNRGIPPGVVATTHQLTQFVQYVDLAARGIAPRGIGEPDVSNRYRTIYPTFVASMIFGTATVKRKIFVEPVGWDSSFLSENAELLINTRRIYHDSTPDNFAEYGNATIFNWVQNVSLHNYGWYDTQWNFPVVYNLKQEVKIGAFADNLNPEQWGRYYPFVDNKNREMRTFGAVSSRVSIAGFIRNKADPIFPQGTDMTLWGAGTFIAHRNRNVAPEGWDSFYNERYTVVWNLADAVAPVGVAPKNTFGQGVVINLNREVKQHSGWEGPVWGLPFIAPRVRSVTPSLFYDVPASFPEVRFNPFPIQPVGIPKLGQVGGHELRIFRREVFPFAVNVHDPWFGEPIVRNRNITVYPYAYEQTEFGRPFIELFIRYIQTEGFRNDDVPKHLITRRTRDVAVQGMAAPSVVNIHRIRNLLPDPPGPQQIDLSKMNEAGEIKDGFGIPPLAIGQQHKVDLRTLFPESLPATTRYGTARVWSTTIIPEFFTAGVKVGVPTLTYTRHVNAKSVPPRDVSFGEPRMTPHNIYAPQGSERPSGYNPNSPGRLIDSGNAPWFGATTVTNQHRAIGPAPRRTNIDDLNGRTKWGNAVFTLRLKFVYVESIRSLRMGFPIFLGVPQYVNFDDPFYPQGLPSSNAFGVTTVAFPVVVDPNKYAFPAGFVATRWGANRVELLNRNVAPAGIPHRGNPQQNLTTPWGTPLVGFPRRYTIGMGSQTLWGNNVIEFVNRPVYPEGWNSLTLEDLWDFENRRFPMKVVRTNPPVVAASLGDMVAFGSCVVSQFVRSVYGRGIDSYNTGTHGVKSVATIGVEGWDSLAVGDIDRWEAGKVKPHGDDMSTVSIPRMLHPLRASGDESSVVGDARVASALSPLGIPEAVVFGPSVTNPFGCTNRVVSVLPILSTQTVSDPVVA